MSIAITPQTISAVIRSEEFKSDKRIAWMLQNAVYNHRRQRGNLFNDAYHAVFLGELEHIANTMEACPEPRSSIQDDLVSYRIAFEEKTRRLMHVFRVLDKGVASIPIAVCREQVFASIVFAKHMYPRVVQECYVEGLPMPPCIQEYMTLDLIASAERLKHLVL